MNAPEPGKAQDHGASCASEPPYLTGLTAVLQASEAIAELLAQDDISSKAAAEILTATANNSPDDADQRQWHLFLACLNRLNCLARHDLCSNVLHHIGGRLPSLLPRVSHREGEHL